MTRRYAAPSELSTRLTEQQEPCDEPQAQPCEPAHDRCRERSVDDGVLEWITERRVDLVDVRDLPDRSSARERAVDEHVHRVFCDVFAVLLRDPTVEWPGPKTRVDEGRPQERHPLGEALERPHARERWDDGDLSNTSHGLAGSADFVAAMPRGFEMRRKMRFAAVTASI